MLRPAGFSGGEGMSNATLLLESLALIKDARDRLSKVEADTDDACDAVLVAGARFWLATTHQLLENLLHKSPRRKA